MIVRIVQYSVILGIDTVDSKKQHSIFICSKLITTFSLQIYCLSLCSHTCFILDRPFTVVYIWNGTILEILLLEVKHLVQW
jgi:hypothetical protein